MMPRKDSIAAAPRIFTHSVAGRKTETSAVTFIPRWRGFVRSLTLRGRVVGYDGHDLMPGTFATASGTGGEFGSPMKAQFAFP